MLSILALIAASVGVPQASLDRVAAAAIAPAPAEAVTVVYLGCQIHETALTACQVVNNDPVEPGAAAEALKLASGMSVPQSVADRLGGHIVVKLNVKQ